MKKKDLERLVKGLGAELVSQGRGHEIWKSKSGKKFTIPRHKEINEYTAKQILKQAEK